MIVNSGALEKSDDDETQKSTNYAKIAKAIGAIRNKNIKVSLVDINKSMFGFIPDAENNEILFGLKGLANVGDDIIETIIAHRPYVSIKDFYNRVTPGKQAMISLIKGGAFDNMMPRREAMAWYLWETCDKKNRLTLQNMNTLIKYELLPKETEEQIMARRVYEFNRYLKSVCKIDGLSKDNYYLDERAINFLTEIGLDNIIAYDDISLTISISVKEWDKIYKNWMIVFKNWMAQNKDEILQFLNMKIFKEAWEKYALGTIPAWEMQSLCFYYTKHELQNVNYSKYGLTLYNSIPDTPIVERSFVKNNRTINMYKLYKICGTCIAKDKTKGIVSLLTTDGVVDVRFRKEYFSLFDKRISAKDSDGTKHIIEKSWFDKGSMIIVQGIKIEDGFMAKKYNSSPGHQLYKIDSIDANGDIIIRSTRAQGDEEDD